MECTIYRSRDIPEIHQWWSDEFGLKTTLKSWVRNSLPTSSFVISVDLSELDVRLIYFTCVIEFHAQWRLYIIDDYFSLLFPWNQPHTNNNPYQQQSTGYNTLHSSTALSILIQTFPQETSLWTTKCCVWLDLILDSDLIIKHSIPQLQWPYRLLWGLQQNVWIQDSVCPISPSGRHQLMTNAAEYNSPPDGIIADPDGFSKVSLI